MLLENIETLVFIDVKKKKENKLKTGEEKNKTNKQKMWQLMKRSNFHKESQNKQEKQ